MVVVSSGTVAPVSGFQRGERRGGGLFASPRGILSVYRGRDIRGGHERDCNTDRAKIRQDEEEENSVRNL